MDVRGARVPADADLVASARAGDQRAFGLLYERHAPAVRRVAAAYVRTPELVADVVQDTFARALEHLDNLRDAVRFRPWLLSIARHTAVDHGRRSVREAGLDAEVAEQLPDRDPSPHDLLEVAEMARRVSTSIADLSRRDATAIALVTYLGFGPAEVAAALGVTPGAAKVLVHRARRRLRTTLSMQTLQHQPDLACGEMQALLTADLVAAARHLEHCDRCLGAASSEVIAFDLSAAMASPAPRDPGPPPGSPPR